MREERERERERHALPWSWVETTHLCTKKNILYGAYAATLLLRARSRFASSSSSIKI